MIKKDNSLALLPRGFVDLLPPFAQIEADAVQTLMAKFASFGYQRIKPPLLEFEDSLLAKGVGEHLAQNTFRVMDPLSRRMLGVRSDSTAQISRIASRMINEPRPLRLTYANDILRMHGSQIRTERQFTQVGCEFIGNDDCIQSDVEICVLSIIGLKSLGITDITLDLTIPNFVADLLSCSDNAVAINKAVAQRDVDSLMSLDCSKAEIIAKVIASSGDFDAALSVLSNLDLPDSLSANVMHLKEICSGINVALSDLLIEDVSLTIDAIEQNGFEYHKNLGFTLFSNGSRGELGGGGCYDVHFGDNNVTATAKGFTLYMDSIIKNIVNPEEASKIFISIDQPWNVISKLQDQGWIVVRGVIGDDKPISCTHIYKDNEIIELSN